MKIRCDLAEARKVMALVEDRHDDLVCTIHDAIKAAIAEHSAGERDRGERAASQPEIDKALAEVMCAFTGGSTAKIERFIDLLRMAAGEDWWYCL